MKFSWKNDDEKLDENMYQKLVPDPYLILVNNPKQLWHAKKFF